jgi:hypothetical protein
MRKYAAGIAAGLLALVFLHIACSLGNPPGTIEDDAIQIMLARSLRHGAFALPDAGGVPMTDPLPGLAFLMMIPVWLVEPHWGLLRFAELLAAVAVPLLTWRLALRFLTPGEAAAAGLLTALCPCILRHSGLVIPDVFLLALSLVLVLNLERARTVKGLGLLAAGAALASLLRPQGALLAPCLALALLPKLKGKKAAAFLAASLAPLAAWSLRNRLVASTVTGYMVNWRSQVAILGDPAHQINHAARLVSQFFAEGLLGMDDFHWKLKLAAGLFLLVLSAAGARRLLRRDPTASQVFVLSAYPILLLALHMTWLAVQTRYAILLAPFVWILAVAGASVRPLPRDAKVVLAAFLSPILLRMDAGLAEGSLSRQFAFQARTMRWLRENTPASAGVESLEFNSVLLLTKRRALPPSLESRDAAGWLAAAGANGISFLHVDRTFTSGGFLPPKAAFVAARLESWARQAPGVALAYEDLEEGTAVYALPSSTFSGKPSRTP